MSALRTLIVGFGGIARGLAADAKMAHWFPVATHAQALRADDGFDWIGVVDPDPAARKCAENDWQVPGFADLAAAAGLAPDVLVLAAPPGARTEVLAQFPTVRAAFTEKPLGNRDGETLLAATDAAGIQLQVNYWRRGDQTLGALSSGGLKSRIGTLQAGTGVYGNGLDNNGSHLIDLIRMLVGEPAWVQAIGDVTQPQTSPIEDDIHTAFALGFDGGAVITVHPLDFSHYREVALDLWGSNGRMSFQQETLNIRHLPRVANRGLENEYEIAADQGTVLPATVADALPRLYRNLHDAVIHGAPLLSPGSSAIVTERIISLIRRSADSGQIRLAVTETT
jgi:predicted dehydrogenase